MTIHGEHDALLVALSLLIAVAASYTALDLAGRTHAASGWARRGWLAAAAIAMGGGIWSMHFVAMLALGLDGIDVVYAPGLTALSVLLAVIATGIGFFVVRTRGVRPAPLGLSGLFMGTGIVAMHYTGMAALRIPAIVIYDPRWVLGSIIIAVGASVAALWLAFGKTEIRHKLTAAFVMGLAISGMHYTGMAGATFSAHASPGLAPAGSGLGSSGLALAVAGTTFVILFFALIASLFDQRFAHLAAREAAALRRSELAFRELYRHTPLPLHATDAEGRIEEVSDAWLHLLGYRREQVIGRPFEDFLETGSAGEPCIALGAVAREGTLQEVECRVVARSGAVLDMLISARAEQDETGGFRRALCGLVDVTARRNAEEALRQSQKMEAIGRITGGVAHDFNNLLSVIVGNLERLQRRVTAPEVLRLIENARAAAERGVMLTQRMLGFARRQDLDPVPLDIADLVNGVSELLRQSLPPEIRLEIEVPVGLPAAEADANQLELALLNLVVNSRDAMAEGGTIRISGRRGEAGEHRELALGDYVCLAVEDDGMGMDADVLSRARDPFFTTKPVGQGTGLGLSMAHGFAQQSGGTLRLHSRKGEGSTVEIWLPVARVAPVVVAEPPAEGKQAVGVERLRILAVDDDPLVLMNTVAILEELGHDVLEARSGPEALEILQGPERFDLVVTDQGMPEMTGLQLAARIRERRPRLPVLLATGYAELPEASPHVRIGKPFDHQILAKAIEKAAVGPALPDATAAE